LLRYQQYSAAAATSTTNSGRCSPSTRTLLCRCREVLQQRRGWQAHVQTTQSSKQEPIRLGTCRQGRLQSLQGDVAGCMHVCAATSLPGGACALIGRTAAAGHIACCLWLLALLPAVCAMRGVPAAATHATRLPDDALHLLRNSAAQCGCTLRTNRTAASLQHGTPQPAVSRHQPQHRCNCQQPFLQGTVYGAELHKYTRFSMEAAAGWAVRILRCRPTHAADGTAVPTCVRLLLPDFNQRV
jgi:hypothetical protein